MLKNTFNKASDAAPDSNLNYSLDNCIVIFEKSKFGGTEIASIANWEKDYSNELFEDDSPFGNGDDWGGNGSWGGGDDWSQAYDEIIEILPISKIEEIAKEQGKQLVKFDEVINDYIELENKNYELMQEAQMILKNEFGAENLTPVTLSSLENVLDELENEYLSLSVKEDSTRMKELGDIITQCKSNEEDIHHIEGFAKHAKDLHNEMGMSESLNIEKFESRLPENAEQTLTDNGNTISMTR